MRRPRIAIIGAGISGLTVASQLHSDFEILVFEAESWIGGHTNTIDVPTEQGTVAVDTGFIVFNDRTYPNFIKMLDRLGVASQPAPMSFSVRADQSNLEYRGADLRGLFAQKRNLFSPRFYRLLNGILKFNRLGTKLLEQDGPDWTVRQFFQQHKVSREFYEYYFLPMGSAIWSCPQSTFQDFPIRFIAEFYKHHGLLGISDRPQWRVVCGGSKSYVAPLIEPFRDRIRTSCPIHSVNPMAHGIRIRHGSATHPGQLIDEEFDHVVFACHGDQALKLLGENAQQDEREVLGAFPYETNQAVLHTDASVLPKRRSAWASWNYWLPDHHVQKASLTYCMNILQTLPGDTTWCVTLNNTDRIDPTKIIKTFNYSHPIFDLRRRQMQDKHVSLIGPNHRSFCGAYWGNGFHEDGVNSGLVVAERLRRLGDGLFTSQRPSAPVPV